MTQQYPDFGVQAHRRSSWPLHAELAIKFMARPIPKVVLPMIFHEVKIQAALGEGHVNLVQVCAMRVLT